MTDTLYRWVKASERKPEARVITKWLNGGDPEQERIDILGKEQIESFSSPSEIESIEWLEPYAPSLNAGSLEEAAEAEAKRRYPEEINVEKSTARNQRKNQRLFIEGAKFGAAYVKGGEEKAEPIKDKEEKTKALMGLVRYGWTCAAEQILNYCNETKVSPQFMDKIMELLDENNKQKFVYEIFQKHIPESSRPSLDIDKVVDELKKIEKLSRYNHNHDNMLYNMQEINKLVQELLNQSK